MLITQQIDNFGFYFLLLLNDIRELLTHFEESRVLITQSIQKTTKTNRKSQLWLVGFWCKRVLVVNIYFFGFFY